MVHSDADVRLCQTNKEQKTISCEKRRPSSRNGYIGEKKKLNSTQTSLQRTFSSSCERVCCAGGEWRECKILSNAISLIQRSVNENIMHRVSFMGVICTRWTSNRVAIHSIFTYVHRARKQRKWKKKCERTEQTLTSTHTNAFFMYQHKHSPRAFSMLRDRHR